MQYKSDYSGIGMSGNNGFSLRSLALRSILLIVVLLVMTDQQSLAQATKVYWSDFGLTKIQRANVDGSSVEDILTSGSIQPFELERRRCWRKVVLD